ncbi:unnamed protein product [Blumeria hordei]|uniref:Candidate secreted effector protein n=1 Tax=Blumeria hordei TaxID=2867405 RepID=A0A383UTX9_BLUHO|nr:unnamed protein product [Blumeria hordei]
MRFSRIAIIFQSASFCTTSLAARYSSHINEVNKVFKCDGYSIAQEEYSRAEAEKFSDSDILQNMYQKHYELIRDLRDTRVVQFHDADNGDYEYFDLTLKWFRYTNELDTVDVQFILVIDRQGRACAMMMRKTIYKHRYRGRQIPRISYKLCEVDSRYHIQ